MLKRIVKFCSHLIRVNSDPPHLVLPRSFVLSKLLSSFFGGLPLPQYLRRRFLPEQIGGGKDLQSWLHLQVSICVSWGLGENEKNRCNKIRVIAIVYVKRCNKI